MIDYATNDEVCRSRQLLNYFGEKSSKDCGQCDVCLSHRDGGLVTEPRLSHAMDSILALLGDGNSHPITDLRDLQLPTDELDAALNYLMKEEYICQEDGCLRKH